MKYIVANWKMNLGIRESVALARGTLLALQGKDVVPEVILCPSATALAEVHKTLSKTRMHLGAQNVGPARAGAYTGEIGVAQLEDLNCTYAIIGHSERRLGLHEPDEAVALKLSAVWESTSITPILCMGEPKDVRDAGRADEYVRGQIRSAVKSLKTGKRKKLIVAYEPVWAIGTGTPATPADAISMSALIRSAVFEATSLKADDLAVLYGGSTNAENAYSFLREPLIDGLLVGGASLKMQDIHGILNSACEVISAQD